MATTVLDRFVVEYLFEGDERGLRKIESAVASARRKLDNLSRAFMVAGAGLTAAGGFVAKAGIETDKAMRQLEARTGATEEQMERLKKQAYQLGSQLPLNTADIIRAATSYIQLGNSIEQAEAALPGIARMAVAAQGLGVEQAAFFASVGLRAFNMEASETESLLDQMLKAETITAATAMDIGDAFRFSAKSASDAGLDTQAYIATLGVLAGSGRTATESSQGLNVLFQKLAKSATGVGRGGEMVRKVFAQAGIEAEELSEVMDIGPTGIFNFLENLRTATAGDQDLLTSVLGTLVGESYASSFSHLVQNVHEARAAYDELMASEGESRRQAEIQMKGLSGAVENIKAQVDTLKNVLSDISVGPWLERLLRGAGDILANLTAMNEEGEFINENLLKVIGTAITLGPLLIGLGILMKGISFALGGWKIAIIAARAAMILFNKVVRKNPLIMAGLAAAGVAGFAIGTEGAEELLGFEIPSLGSVLDNVEGYIGDINEGIDRIIGLQDQWDEATQGLDGGDSFGIPEGAFVPPDISAFMPDQGALDIPDDGVAPYEIPLGATIVPEIEVGPPDAGVIVLPDIIVAADAIVSDPVLDTVPRPDMEPETEAESGLPELDFAAMAKDWNKLADERSSPLAFLQEDQPEALLWLRDRWNNITGEWPESLAFLAVERDDVFGWIRDQWSDLMSFMGETAPELIPGLDFSAMAATPEIQDQTLAVLPELDSAAMPEAPGIQAPIVTPEPDFSAVPDALAVPEIRPAIVPPEPEPRADLPAVPEPEPGGDSPVLPAVPEPDFPAVPNGLIAREDERASPLALPQEQQDDAMFWLRDRWNDIAGAWPESLLFLSEDQPEALRWLRDRWHGVSGEWPDALTFLSVEQEDVFGWIRDQWSDLMAFIEDNRPQLLPETPDILALTVAPEPFDIPGITAPLPAGPPAAAAEAVGPVSGQSGSTIHVTIGEIRIDVSGGDAEEIAKNVGDALNEQLETLTHKADSQVAR